MQRDGINTQLEGRQKRQQQWTQCTAQAELLSPSIKGRSEGQSVICFPACWYKAKWHRPWLMGIVIMVIVNIYWALTTCCAKSLT